MVKAAVSQSRLDFFLPGLSVRPVKYATFSKSVFAVTAILVATACADSADVPEEEVAPEPAPASTVPPASKPTPPPPVPEKKCPGSCTTDADCQNACPAVSGGVNCCDTKSGACFPSKTATCPAPAPDPVDPDPTY